MFSSIYNLDYTLTISLTLLFLSIEDLGLFISLSYIVSKIEFTSLYS